MPIERVLQRTRGQKVILLHVKQIPPLVPVPGPLQPLVFGDPTQYQGSAFILQEDNKWSKAGKEPTAGFNCHAYALGERVGLTPEDWVEGEPTNLSENTNPMEALLSVYCRHMKTLPASQADLLSQDSHLKEGDIVSFVLGILCERVNHLHSGRIKLVNGENWMASKFRAGRLLVTPISEALQVYPITEKICIYRFRNK
jgi:hypothetical protein